jgi:hypothetical protein
LPRLHLQLYKQTLQIMRQKIFLFALLAFSLSFTACKKESSSSSSNTDKTAEVSAQVDDQSRFSSETDAVSNDADVALESSSSFAGRPDQTQSLICDATIVVDTLSDPRTITITYNGTNCAGNRTRTGVVVISKPAGVHWKNAGAAITITYQDLKITRISDNKSITINGEHTVTNVSGGLLFNLSALGSITHSITSSGMTVTFDDGTQRSWQVSRQRVFSYDNGVVIKTRGTHTDGSATNIAEWGTNRKGDAFTSATREPLVVRQDCSFRLVSGTIIHTTPDVTVTTTFGLDAGGNPTTCPSGHFYYKLVWTGAGGNTHTLILPY